MTSCEVSLVTSRESQPSRIFYKEHHLTVHPTDIKFLVCINFNTNRSNTCDFVFPVYWFAIDIWPWIAFSLLISKDVKIFYNVYPRTMKVDNKC